MRLRWGLGPVFVYEWLTATRRWQMYALRALFVGLLFLAIVIVWMQKAEPLIGNAGRLDRKAHADVGQALFFAFFGTLLSVTLLVAPGATAGAVCLDKARGTLLHVLVTDLSAREIVFGKLAARLLPLFGLVLASIPVLSLCLWLGGIDPQAMLVAYAVTIGLVVLGSCLAFLLSVWGRKTHEVLLVTYLFEILLVMAYPIAIGLDAMWKQTWLSPYVSWTNPYRLAFSPYMFRGATNPIELIQFLGFCLGVGAVSAILAALTIRRVAVRQASRPLMRRRRLLPWLRRPRWLTPRLDANPVYWREWHRQGPSRWVRIVWAVYAVCAVAATTSVVYERANRSGAWAGEFGAIVSAFQVSIGLLLASVAAVTSLSEERVRGSLDVLLATPLRTSSIVWGKWRGAFRLVPWLAVLPTINVATSAAPGGNAPPWMAAGMSAPPPPRHPELLWLCVPLMAGLVLAYGAAVTSFGLACATWIRRQGRAIAVSVVAYALMTAGWVAMLAAISGPGQEIRHLMMASPFYGPGQLNADSTRYSWRTNDDLPDSFIPAFLWTVAYAAAALSIYLAVLGTFDRNLGRAPERAYRPRRRATRLLSPTRNPQDVRTPLVIEMPAEDEQQVG